MKYKLPALDVPSENPFRNDALDRKGAVELLAGLLHELTGPFVLAIDSPWGTGKTTFVRFLEAHLRSTPLRALRLSAWEVDYAADPLLPLLGELERFLKSEEAEELPNPHFSRAKRLATLLLRRGAPIAAKVATAGLLDLEKLYEDALADFASAGISDAIDVYTKEREILEEFRTALTSAVGDFTKDSEKKVLVVFIDEIDRCRPTFAVELLERIKHLFNLPNVIFVLALDKAQLGSSLRAVYGEGLNTNEYLRRFLDLEYALSPPNAEAFFDSLFSRFGFEQFFSERTHRELQYEHRQLRTLFVALADASQLSLRSQEQCFTQLRVAMSSTPADHYFHPIIVAALIILKTSASEVYRRFAFEGHGVQTVIDHFRSTTKGKKFLESHEGAVLEAYLLHLNKPRHVDSPEELQRYLEIAKDETASEAERERANKLVGLLQSYNFSEKAPSLAQVIKKIELASGYH